MKVDKVVKKETLNIGLGILVCSVITLIVFLICGRFSLAVLLGSIYGGAITLLNFFLMGVTVQSASMMEDGKKAKRRIQSSYSMRQLGLLFLVGIGMYIAVTYKIFHWLPILLSVFYPRLTIFYFTFSKRKGNKGGDVT